MFFTIVQSVISTIIILLSCYIVIGLSRHMKHFCCNLSGIEPGSRFGAVLLLVLSSLILFFIGTVVLLVLFFWIHFTDSIGICSWMIRFGIAMLIMFIACNVYFSWPKSKDP